MTQMPEKAYAQIIQLPDAEQDSIAALIFDDLESEEKWSRQFADSADVLSRLAKQARAEIHAGKTLPLDPDTL